MCMKFGADLIFMIESFYEKLRLCNNTLLSCALLTVRLHGRVFVLHAFVASPQNFISSLKIVFTSEFVKI